MKLRYNTSNIFFYFIVLSAGYYLTLIKGYGTDTDTPGVVSAYIAFVEKGIYEPSRGYGHPVAELIIGFFGYYFGAVTTTYLSFLAFFLSLIFFYISFKEYFFQDRLKLFLILSLSNSLLFFDNVNSSDFPWSLFFFSLGFLLMRKEKYFFSCIFFALSIGCRYNFIIFVYASIFSHWIINFNKINFKKIFTISFGILLGIIIIYFPINFFYTENISFAFSDRVAVPGTGYKIESLLPRFVYKNFKLFGTYSSYLILFFLAKEFLFKKDLINSKIFKYSILIILLNFIIFFIFPGKISYLHTGIILIYIILVSTLKKKYLYLIVLFNLLQWVISYDFVKINYKHKDLCKPTVAISAKIDPHFKYGEYYSMLLRVPIKDCFSKIYSEGLPLKGGSPWAGPYLN